MERAAIVVALVYGALVLLGGLFGYLKARSKPSLIMGGLFGIALIGVGIAGHLGWTLAPAITALLAGVLLAFFGSRFLRKKKFMPAGFLAALSLVALLVEVAAIVTQG